MSIAILTPSRERAGQLELMLDAIVETECSSKIEVYIGLDDDDLSSGYAPTDWYGDVRLHWTVGPRDQLAGWTNRLALQALADGHDILASFGDDHRPRTAGWDLQVIDAFADMGPGLVYTRDGLQDERLPTAPFWHAYVIRALGYFFPPTLSHMYADNWWLKFATDLRRFRFLPDVLIEHCHPATGKVAPDAINAANDTHYAADEAAYHAMLADGTHAAAVERVRSALA